MRRQILSFGADFAANFQSLRTAPAITNELSELRKRAVDVSHQAGDFRQALLQRFPAGASIGHHCDSAAFGTPILGISFGSHAEFQFRHIASSRRVSLQLPPRSLYILDEEARTTWTHAIAPVPELRYSVTFRRIKSPCNLRLSAW